VEIRQIIKIDKQTPSSLAIPALADAPKVSGVMENRSYVTPFVLN